MRPFLCMAIFVAVLLAPAAASAEAFCEPGQSPAFTFGLASLKDALGDTMGDPLECAHLNPDNGDVLQQTSAGLAVYRAASNVPTFSNGFDHWALTEQGLVSWSGAASDPPASKLVAFVGDNDATFLLYPDGTLASLAVYPGVSSNLGRVALDPLSRTVATTRTVDRTSEIVLIDIASADTRSVPGSGERNCHAPSFLPDGAHLLAVCQPPTDLGGNKQDVSLFDLDKGFIRTVAVDPGGNLDSSLGVLDRPLVSPDGQTAILEGSIPQTTSRLWRLDIATGTVTPFVVEGMQACDETACVDSVKPVAFSADGRILTTICHNCVNPSSDAGDPMRDPLDVVHSDVVLLNLDGTHSETLYGADRLVLYPALSPDGATLLFSAYPDSGTSAILWSLDRASGEMREVARGRAAVFAQPALRQE